MIEQTVRWQRKCRWFYMTQLCCSLVVWWWQLFLACFKFESLPLFGCAAWRLGRAVLQNVLCCYAVTRGDLTACASGAAV
jgi:hypothetical protein